MLGIIFFRADHIFDEGTSTAAIFDEIAKPIVDATLKGFNGTIFAYGQTSSGKFRNNEIDSIFLPYYRSPHYTGKTHTMLGDDTGPGIMQLAIRELFHDIEKSQNQQFLLRVGYIEIYNEKVYDLLDKTNVDLKIQENARCEVTVNHREVIVSSEENIMSQLQIGNKQRKVACTAMNDRSSRSHTIFRLVSIGPVFVFKYLSDTSTNFKTCFVVEYHLSTRTYCLTIL